MVRIWIALLVVVLVGAAHAQVGRRFPAEKTTGTDPVTGLMFTRLTSNSEGSSKPYQTHPTWTADGQWIISRANRDGSGPQAFLIHERTGDIVQVTEGPASGTGSLNLSRRAMKLYVIRGGPVRSAGAGARAAERKDGEPAAPRPALPRQLVVIDLAPLLADALAGTPKPAAAYERVISTLPSDLRDAGGLAIDADESAAYWGVGWGPLPEWQGPTPAADRVPATAATSADRSRVDGANTNPAEARETARQRFAALGRGPGGIRRIDLQTGAITTVIDVDFRMGHVQTSHWVPGEIIYCHETTGDSPQRMWTVRADGTGNRPLYREHPDEWVTHETSCGPDEVMFNVMGHLPYLRARPTGLAVVHLRTGEMKLLGQVEEQMPNGGTGGFWHGNGSPDGRWAVADTFKGDVYLIDRQSGRVRRLTTGHVMRPDHAHPIFSPDSKRVLVQSGRFGEGRKLDLVTVEIPAAWSRAVEPFPLAAVRLRPGPFQEAQERDRQYLHALDENRLLHNFRRNAGLPSTATPLGGWEAPGCELRGHGVGHYLSACAQMYAATGDEVLRAKGARMVAGLAVCQAEAGARGFTAGYLSAFPETFFDRVDTGQPVWAPYYTLHKIFAGLLDQYALAGNREALAVAQGMARWLALRLARLTPAQQQRALRNEHGGMVETLVNLHGYTGDPEHLRLARAFEQEEILAPLARGEDRLDGLHANTQIPKIVGAARLYEETGERRQSDIARAFWRFVALDRSYCHGGHSDSEHFFPVQDFARHLSPVAAETCNTYNLLKLTQHLYSWQPESAYMDFYERALYNHILASQDPRTGMMFYFASLKPGHFKNYNTPHDSFWCCTGTGWENHARYGEAIYHRSTEGTTLWVNLFIASEVHWPEKGLTVRQETRFPDDEEIRLTFHCAAPVSCTVKVRRPTWMDPAGGYETHTRTWREGDTLVVRRPLRLRVEALPQAPRHVAFMCGPIVLAGELGTAGLERINCYVGRQIDLTGSPAPSVPVLLSEPDQVWRHVEPVPGRSLTFRTRGIGQPQDVTLSPYFRLHHQRENVYWTLYRPEEWEQQKAVRAAAEEAQRRYERRLVDAVQPGEQQSETDHRYRGESSRSGYTHDRSWRDTRKWISYELKVRSDRAQVVRCTYWGGDSGQRKFTLLADGVKIGEQRLSGERPGALLEVDYPLPAAVIQGKDRVTLRFEAAPDHLAGGVFGVAVLLAEEER